jgi:hypothetical protein
MLGKAAGRKESAKASPVQPEAVHLEAEAMSEENEPVQEAGEDKVVKSKRKGGMIASWHGFPALLHFAEV